MGAVFSGTLLVLDQELRVQAGIAEDVAPCSIAGCGDGCIAAAAGDFAER